VRDVVRKASGRKRHSEVDVYVCTGKVFKRGREKPDGYIVQYQCSWTLRHEARWEYRLGIIEVKSS